MNQILKFQFKASTNKNALLKEFIGTWKEMDMYYPSVIIVNRIPVQEEELELV